MNRHLHILHSELSRALFGLDERQTQLRPATDAARWNIQQVAGHLRLTYAATVDAMDARIAKAAGTKAIPSPLQYVAQFTLIRVGYFPRGRKAPERVIAATDESAASGSILAAGLENTLLLMDSRIDTAEALFGGKRRVVSHMVLGPLSVDQWRKFHLIHGRHHIRQILALRREHGI